MGIAAGTYLAYRLAQKRLPLPQVVLDAVFWGVLGGLLGGRVGYVIANGAYFAEHWAKAFALWKGGLTWHGALIGGSISIAYWYILRRKNTYSTPDWRILLDTMAPGLALGGAFGWLGCLLTGCAYGAQASGYAPPLSWIAADLPDLYGVDEIRFATQPLMIACCLLICLLLLWLQDKWPAGLGFALYLLLCALADFGIAFLRGDGTWRFGLWLSQWMAIAEMLVAVALGAYVLSSARARDRTR